MHHKTPDGDRDLLCFPAGGTTPQPEIERLRARVAEMEARLVEVLRTRPLTLECEDFNHSLRNQHDSFDCPCVDQWNAAIDTALALLKRDPALHSKS